MTAHIVDFPSGDDKRYSRHATREDRLYRRLYPGRGETCYIVGFPPGKTCYIIDVPRGKTGYIVDFSPDKTGYKVDDPTAEDWR